MERSLPLPTVTLHNTKQNDRDAQEVSVVAAKEEHTKEDHESYEMLCIPLDATRKSSRSGVSDLSKACSWTIEQILADDEDTYFLPGLKIPRTHYQSNCFAKDESAGAASERPQTPVRDAEKRAD